MMYTPIPEQQMRAAIRTMIYRHTSNLIAWVINRVADFGFWLNRKLDHKPPTTKPLPIGTTQEWKERDEQQAGVGNRESITDDH